MRERASLTSCLSVSLKATAVRFAGRAAGDHRRLLTVHLLLPARAMFERSAGSAASAAAAALKPRQWHRSPAPSAAVPGNAPSTS